MAIGFLAGSFFGSKIALSISQETLKKVFAMLMILIAIKMLFLDKSGKPGNETKLQQPVNSNANAEPVNLNKTDGG